VRQILATNGYQIKQKQIDVSVGVLPETRADRVSMEQIMSNLLNNAIKFLDPNRPGRIEIAAESHFDENIFHVRDNGVGIEDMFIDSVFNMFKRTGKQNTEGEGIGLACARTLVRRHGGRIWCKAEPGVGSLFSFSISKIRTATES
jgi:signal transduction histidine kinase